MTSAEFAEWVEGLLEAPLPEPAEGDAWFARHKPFLDRLDELPGLDADFFHFIHHYVSDADIRREDREYRDAQDAALHRYLVAYQARSGTQDA